MDDTRIVSGFGKTVAAQEYLLVDDQGRTLAVLSATQGKPALAFYNGMGEIRAWFTLTAEERPDIRFFDKSGDEVWRYRADGVMARTPHPESGVDQNMARTARPEVATRRKRNGGKPYAG
jgi:hypothetical protein